MPSSTLESPPSAPQLAPDGHTGRADRRIRVPWLALATFTGLFVLAAALQVHRGAFHSDFAAHPDEPSHLVTGLMAHDWLSTPLHPLRFAEEYYRHYPKVAIGQWPPVFYALQALWFLVFGTSATALVLLMSTLTAGTGALLLHSIRPTVGLPLAVSAAVVFVLTPLTQIFSGRVMTEVPLALFCLGAAVAFGRFLEAGRARHAIGFALWSVAAIMTKGNGLALGLLPPVAIVVSRRFELLKRPALWASALLVGAVCAPWYKLALPISQGTWAGGAAPTLEYTRNAARYYGPALLHLGGIAVSVFALTGLVRTVLRGRAQGTWAALSSLVLCVLALHCVLPSSIQERHLILLAPAWFALAALGADGLARRVGNHADAAAGLAVVLVTLFALERFESPPKDVHGYGTAARELAGHRDLDQAALLIASDAIGEGGFVAAVALLDERPGRFVLRGSKTLGRETWLGTQYTARFPDGATLEAWLARVPVAVILIDRSIESRRWRSYHDQLTELVARDPARWQRIGTWDVMREGERFAGALSAWRQVGIDTGRAVELSLDEVLGRSVPGAQ